MSSKFLKTGLATAAALAALVTAAPMAAQAQANGVTNCDAPGGRQRVGALIGAVMVGFINNGLNLLNMPSSFHPLATGIVILVALILNQGVSLPKVFKAKAVHKKAA